MIKFITLPNGERYRWKDILRLRKEQDKAARQPQPTLFPLQEDSRPATQRRAEGRYTSPTLFEAEPVLHSDGNR